MGVGHKQWVEMETIFRSKTRVVLQTFSLGTIRRRLLGNLVKPIRKEFTGKVKTLIACTISTLQVTIL